MYNKSIVVLVLFQVSLSVSPCVRIVLYPFTCAFEEPTLNIELKCVSGLADRGYVLILTKLRGIIRSTDNFPTDQLNKIRLDCNNEMFTNC
jgi:hypothetical protein